MNLLLYTMSTDDKGNMECEHTDQIQHISSGEIYDIHIERYEIY